jgi:hypothetical protein
MPTLLNNDDAIWLKHVDAQPDLSALLYQLRAGTRIRLEIDGVAGDWEKMAEGKDKRPTQGLKPVGQTRDFWKAMRTRRGERMRFRVVDPRDGYVEALQKTLSEWESPADERAFNDL